MQVAYLGDSDIAGDPMRRGATTGHFSIGNTYTVYGMRFEPKPCAVTVDVITEGNRLVGAPLSLSRITDARASRNWEARVWEDGALTLWPASLYLPYYHNDLSEDVPDVSADFRRVRATMESEFTESSM